MQNKATRPAAEATWKEKYLDCLEAIEQLEHKNSKYIELLKRCMVRVSLAADGIDDGLDETLASLREAMRQELSSQQLETLGREVENSVLNLDKRKASNSSELLTEFNALVQQLIDLEPPRKTKRSLKSFQKKLEPLLDGAFVKASILAEYAALQSEVLTLVSPELSPEKSSDKKPGLFKRLFNDQQSRIKTNAAERETDENFVSAVDSEDFELGELAESVIEEDSFSDNDSAEFFAKSPESEAIRERMSGILLALLEQLYIPTSWKKKEAAIRHRIDRGIRWEEVPSTLSELVSLVADSSGQLQKDTEIFLQNLNARLYDIQDFLVQSQKRNTEKEAQSEQLDEVVKGHIKDIQQRLSNVDQIGELKGSIELHLLSIMAEIENYKNQEKDIDNETLESVKALTSRIETLEKEARVIKESYIETKEKAYTDTLTKLPNRLAYEKRSLQEYSRWHRYQNPLSIAVCDLDLFKTINDSYGHTAGDKVLQKIGQTFQKCLRTTDFACRFGGEEFVVLMPETTEEQAVIAMEKLRQLVEESPFHFRGERVAVTVSVGVSEFHSNQTLEQIFDQADKAVYEAKRMGRNRVFGFRSS